MHALSRYLRSSKLAIGLVLGLCLAGIVRRREIIDCFVDIRHQLSIQFPPEYVFCGDSITEGGGNWAKRLGVGALSTRNLARSGSTVEQIVDQVRLALEYEPDFIFVMGGTNDIFDDTMPAHHALSDFEIVLSLVAASKCRCIVTLVPLHSLDRDNASVEALNSGILDLCAKHGASAIDLNPTIAPKGRLLLKYTTDGVHFSEAAYSLWASKLKNVILSR